jgi:hypothetical protein
MRLRIKTYYLVVLVECHDVVPIFWVAAQKLNFVGSLARDMASCAVRGVVNQIATAIHLLALNHLSEVRQLERYA